MSSSNRIGLAVVSLSVAALDFQTGETLIQHIPGTDVSITMAQIPGGTFKIDSPENEPGRDPVHRN